MKTRTRQAEDPERPGASGGARRQRRRRGGTGELRWARGALTRRAVTLRVLLKDALLEPRAPECCPSTGEHLPASSRSSSCRRGNPGLVCFLAAAELV